MAAQARKAHSKQQRGRKGAQTAPLTRMVVTDALRTWIPPTAAAVVGLVIFVLFNIGIVEEASAVSIVGSLALLLLLFYGVRSFTEQAVPMTVAAALVVFVVLWGTAIYYPFYRTLNPGDPLFTKELARNQSVTVPLAGKAGHYSVLTEGHFTPVQGQQNRTAVYHIEVGHGGAADTVLEGTFEQEWRQERIGAGRRSSVVPALHQKTRHRNEVDDSDGHDLTLKLADLSAEAGDKVTVRVYDELMPQWLLIALGGITLLSALLVDGFRPKGQHEALTSTLTAATLVGLAVFCKSAPAAPGFPQLIVAAVAGVLVSAVSGFIFARVTQPIRRVLPALD